MVLAAVAAVVDTVAAAVVAATVVAAVAAATVVVAADAAMVVAVVVAEAAVDVVLIAITKPISRFSINSNKKAEANASAFFLFPSAIT